MGVGKFCCPDHFLIRGIRSGKSYIFKNRTGKQKRFLQYDTKLCMIFFGTNFLNIRSIDQYRTVVYFIQPHDQIDQRRFSCAGSPDDTDHFSRFHRQIYLFQNRLIRFISKRRMGKCDFSLHLKIFWLCIVFDKRILCQNIIDSFNTADQIHEITRHRGHPVEIPARDYLVPARNHPGKFYALPQAPQQFKQILMASGFDRYFQIAPCFRDEDARADRSPGEFYQLDMEMAFASQEDVFSIVEQVLPPVFEKYGIYKNASKAPFVRIPYLEAMDKYGSDKPDLRIDLVLTDATEVMQGCGFAAFEGQTVKAIVVDGFTATRKQIDAICAEVEVQTARKGFWFRVDENGEFVGGISKFLQDRKEEVIKALGLKNGDFVGLAAGKKLEAQKTAGVYRKLLGAASEKHMKKDCYEFCWIVDFPMYEIGEESGELEFCHNPFSMPQGGMDALNNQDPLEILAYQYDLVCNGVELSSGAVRNHDPEIMIKAFELVGLGEADVKAKFPAMYNAFCYGAPPHAGIAPGVDRMIMLICGEESIREIIPFPMNKNAMDIMMGAPGTVEQKQLDELHLAITAKPEE